MQLKKRKVNQIKYVHCSENAAGDDGIILLSWLKLGTTQDNNIGMNFILYLLSTPKKFKNCFAFFVISCDALLLFLVIVFDSGARKHTQIAVFFLFCFVRNYFWITDRVSVSLISLCQFFSGIKSLTQREPINCQHVPIHSLTNSFQNNFQQQIIHLEADPLLSLFFCFFK